MLDEETLLLEYALGQERSFLFVLSPHWLETRKLPPGAEIEQAARQVHDLLSDAEAWNSPDDGTRRRHGATYRTAAPGKKTGSVWEQTIVFPKGKRYFVSSDKVTAVNTSPAMFQRIDMPGHIRHKRGDTFSEIYLSYYDQTNRPAARWRLGFR